MNTSIQTDSSLRFSLLDLDISDATPAPTSLALPPVPVPGVTVIEPARLAAEREQALAAEVGLPMPATWFAVGTKMLETGENRAHALRSSWEKLPPAGEALTAVIETIREENREDFIRPLGRMEIDGQGRLGVMGGTFPASSLTERSMRQLAHRAPAGTPGALRYNLNAWASRATQSVRLRTRDAGQGRETFAVLSDKYAVVDVNQLAAMMRDHIPEGARARISYDRSRARASLDVSVSNPFEVKEELGVGRAHVVGVRVTTDDVGGESIRVRKYVERIACINCTILPGEKVTKRYHMGNAASIVEEIRAAIEDAANAANAFGKLWSDASQRKIHALYDGSESSARNVFRTLVNLGHVEVDGVKKDDLAERLLLAWSREPGDTEAAVNRAITRAAHTESWADDQCEALEEQAGQLLYNRVLRTDFAYV